MKKKLLSIVAILCIVSLLAGTLSGCSIFRLMRRASQLETQAEEELTESTTQQEEQTEATVSDFQQQLCSDLWESNFVQPGDSYVSFRFQNDGTVVAEFIGNEDGETKTAAYTVSGESASFEIDEFGYTVTTTANQECLYCEDTYQGKDNDSFFLLKESASSGDNLLEGKENLHSDYLSDLGYDGFYLREDDADYSSLCAATQANPFELKGYAGSEGGLTSFYNYDGYEYADQPSAIAFLRGDDGQLYAYLFYYYTDSSYNVIKEVW
ncbi:MAG: hypothetical protein IJJ41_02445 [Clostridia bacterium]|nr:hypothetical protein [Clostridia bacterium]